jgi:hypothetical protein
MKHLATEAALSSGPSECLLLECPDRDLQLLITIAEAERFTERFGLTVEPGQITVARLRMLLTSFSVVGPNGEHVDESEYKTPQKYRPVESVAFKGSLKQFSDGSGMFGKKTCWSVVETPEGEKLWISVAQTGVVVKQTQLSPLGPTIVNIKGLEASWRVSSKLGNHFRDEHIPEGMENLELITFTLVAMEAANTAEFISRVRKAIEEAGLEAAGG